MAMIDVTFEIKQSDGSVASILLAPDGDRIHLDFDDDDKAKATLNGKRDYPFEWEFVGKDGDSLTVTFSGGGIDDLLIDDFKIDRNSSDTRPWPGGWKSIGKSIFPRIEP